MAQPGVEFNRAFVGCNGPPVQDKKREGQYIDVTKPVGSCQERIRYSAGHPGNKQSPMVANGQWQAQPGRNRSFSRHGIGLDVANIIDIQHTRGKQANARGGQ